MQELSTTAEVMDVLGGTTAVAALTGRKYDAAWNWKTFKHFPPDTYLVMAGALMAKGYTAPTTLWRMVQPEAAAS